MLLRKLMIYFISEVAANENVKKSRKSVLKLYNGYYSIFYF